MKNIFLLFISVILTQFSYAQKQILVSENSDNATFEVHKLKHENNKLVLLLVAKWVDEELKPISNSTSLIIVKRSDIVIRGNKEFTIDEFASKNEIRFNNQIELNISYKGEDLSEIAIEIIPSYSSSMLENTAPFIIKYPERYTKEFKNLKCPQIIVTNIEKIGDPLVESLNPLILIEGYIKTLKHIENIKVNGKIIGLNKDSEFTYYASINKVGENHIQITAYDKLNNVANKELILDYQQIGSKELEIEIITPELRGFKKAENQNKYPVLNKKGVEVIVNVKGGYGQKNVDINGSKATQYANGQYHKQVKLVTGENIIDISVEDKNNDKINKQIKVVCTYQYDIDVNNGKYYALLIGVNDYNDESFVDLDRPLTDAIKLKKSLIKNYTFKEAQISLLENPTKELIKDEFERLAKKINKEDNLLIFYAGHGVWNDNSKIGYWLPSNANSLETDNWLKNSTLIKYINGISSKHTLLISDACFSGSIFKTRSLGGTALVAYNKLYKLKSRKGMTSGTLKTVPDVSVFFEVLLKRLEENKDKYLPAAKLFNNMRDAILNNSSNVPQYGNLTGLDDEGGEFIFISK